VNTKVSRSSVATPTGIIDITYSDWFNPRREYKYYMVPAILVLLLTLIGGFVTALNIVREKEIGTIEQINVTPIKKWQFILGKLIPFWIVGMIVFTVGLIVMYVVYSIFPKGSMLVLYLFACRVPDRTSGTWSVDLHVQQQPAASHVRCVFLHDDFYV
jgi:ABC-2 type transport system permease protein